MSAPPLRGQVIRADIRLDEPKLFVVVSNNSRNQNLQEVLGARLTTTSKQPRQSIVELGQTESFHGRVVCDDLMPIWKDEIISVVGALSPTAMRAVEDGLMAALGISR